MAVCEYCGRECRNIFKSIGLCDDPHCIEQAYADLGGYLLYPEEQNEEEEDILEEELRREEKCSP